MSMLRSRKGVQNQALWLGTYYVGESQVWVGSGILSARSITVRLVWVISAMEAQFSKAESLGLFAWYRHAVLW